jgi:hypothetical protein
MSQISSIECIDGRHSDKCKVTATRANVIKRGVHSTTIANSYDYKVSELQFAKRLLDASQQRRRYKHNVLLQIEQELGDDGTISSSYSKKNHYATN